MRGGNLAPIGTTLLICLPPALLLFTLFVVLPVGEAAWYSFFRWDGFGTPTEWVGLRNYESLFVHRVFHVALRNNLLIIAVSLAIQLPLALAMALILAERIPAAPVFRMIFFLPYVLAEIAAGLIWRFAYDGDYGLVASIARALGTTAPHVLADPAYAEAAILSVIVWRLLRFHDAVHRRAAGHRPQPLRRGARRRRHALAAAALREAAAAEANQAVGVLYHPGSFQLFDLVMPMTRGGRRTHADDGELSVQPWHHAHARGLRQRDRRRGAVRDLRPSPSATSAA
jgi:raffinose/stachyose/melibiose transport system permease protein